MTTKTRAPASYSRVAKLLHWTIAVLIIAQFVGGKFMTHLEFGIDQRFLIYQMHKSFGFVVLALSLYRLYWRLTHKTPELPEGMSAFERIVAPITHWLFYGFMILVPLTGWLYVSAQTAIETKFFFLVPVFHFPVPETEGAQELFEGAHGALATAMIALLVLHVAAALKHHFIEKDMVFRHMLTGKGQPSGKLAVPAITGALVLVAVVYLVVMLVWGEEHEEEEASAGAPVAAEQAVTSSSPVTVSEGPNGWVLDPAESHVTLRGEAFGSEKTIRLGTIEAEIVLDLEDPAEAGRIDARLLMTSLEGDNVTVNELQGSQWFDTANYPVVRFVADEISGDDGGYVAQGTLTIRETSQPLTLPFAVVAEGGRAVAEAEVTVDRHAFGLGGEGNSVSSIVTVTLHVEADRAD